MLKIRRIYNLRKQKLELIGKRKYQKNNKQLKITFLHRPVLNAIQYKQLACILPCLKCNVLFVDQTRTTYSSEERKLKKLLIVKTELSINVKTENIFI